jgi:hypothetical protein
MISSIRREGFMCVNRREDVGDQKHLITMYTSTDAMRGLIENSEHPLFLTLRSLPNALPLLRLVP